MVESSAFNKNNYHNQYENGVASGTFMDNNNEMNDNLDNEIFDKDCPDYNYKLILVGHERVGKTSIINRFVNGMFNEAEASSKTVQI